MPSASGVSRRRQKQNKSSRHYARKIGSSLLVHYKHRGCSPQGRVMVENAVKFPEHAATLERFVRITDNNEVADELATLLGRAPLFSEFTHDDIKALAEYMGVYR